MKRKKNNKLEFIKVKNWCSMKDTLKKMKIKAPDWEKIFSKHMSNKELVFTMHKEPLRLNNQEINNLNLKCANALRKLLNRKDPHMTI